MRRLSLLLAMTVLLGACQGQVPGYPDEARFQHATVIGEGPVRFSYQRIAAERASELLGLAERKIAEVEAYLGREARNGVAIFERNDANPSLSVTFARIRADGDADFWIGIHRQRLEAGGGDTTLVHELTHAVAGPPKDNNLVLAEGLAVHVHGLLSEPAEAMSYARLPLQRLARDVLLADPYFPRLTEFFRDHRILRTQPTSDRDVVRRKQAAYFVAGSFVRFLVEMRDIATFMKLYDSGDFEAVYGMPLAELEERWRAQLGLDAIYPHPPAVRL